MTGSTPATPTLRHAWPVLAILLVAAVPQARGQDDLDEPEEQPVVNNVAIDESNFDRWVYGNMGGTVAGARDRLEALLSLSIDEADRTCKLTEAQKKKLRLAGHGDLKRFLGRVEEARRVFRQLNRDQNNVNQLHQETIPLAATLRAGLYGDDSFFGKTLRTTLDPEQAGRYRETSRRRPGSATGPRSRSPSRTSTLPSASPPSSAGSSSSWSSRRPNSRSSRPRTTRITWSSTRCPGSPRRSSGRSSTNPATATSTVSCSNPATWSSSSRPTATSTRKSHQAGRARA